MIIDFRRSWHREWLTLFPATDPMMREVAAQREQVQPISPYHRYTSPLALGPDVATAIATSGNLTHRSQGMVKEFAINRTGSEQESEVLWHICAACPEVGNIATFNKPFIA